MPAAISSRSPSARDHDVRLGPHVVEDIEPRGVERVDLVLRHHKVVHEVVAEPDRGDRVVHALDPALGRAHAQQHLGVGVDVHQLTPVVRAGPVDDRLLALEELLPRTVALEGRAPLRDARAHVGHHVAHVVAGQSRASRVQSAGWWSPFVAGRLRSVSRGCSSSGGWARRRILRCPRLPRQPHGDIAAEYPRLVLEHEHVEIGGPALDVVIGRVADLQVGVGGALLELDVVGEVVAV